MDEQEVSIMPEEYRVSLNVRLSVHADDPKQAMVVAKEWLQRTLSRADDQREVFPRVFPSASDEALSEEYASSSSDYKNEIRAERQKARESGGEARAALLTDLAAARTTEDYQNAETRVSEWLASHKEHSDTALPHLKSLLETFREAIRWSEQHPNSPTPWNVGRLLTTIKQVIQQERDATNPSGRFNNSG